MGRYFSDELFHFVGHAHPEDHERNYSVLKLILQKGRISHPPHTDDWGTTSVSVTWENMLVSGMIVPTVLCLCDIPFEHLAVHVSKYGVFGLSLPKHLLARHGARPVMYVPLRADNRGSPFGSVLLRHIEQVFRGFRRQIVEENDSGKRKSRTLGRMPMSAQEAASAMDSIITKDFLAFAKPYDSELPEGHLDRYYSEREWRKFGNQRFDPRDVRRVVVAPGFAQRLAQELPQYSTKIESIHCSI
jgi:hypothetical protein